jgi:hypothetical protein
MPTEIPLADLIQTYYRRARLRQWLESRLRPRHTDIELSTLSQVDRVLEEKPMHCANCLRNCSAVRTVVDVRGKIDDRRGYYSEDVWGEASDCCEAEILSGPGPTCVACDNPAQARCPECGEWLCATCLPVCGGGPTACKWCLEEQEQSAVGSQQEERAA